MAAVIEELIFGIHYCWDESDHRTMRALERRGCARYVRSRDAWIVTASGRQALAHHIEMGREIET